MVGQKRKFFRFEALKQPFERIEIQIHTNNYFNCLCAFFFSKLTIYFVIDIVEFKTKMFI